MTNSFAPQSLPASTLFVRAYADRLVAGARVVLAATAVVAIALDPDVGRDAQFFGLVVLAFYLIGALAQFAIVLRTLRPRRAVERFELAADAVFIATLMVSTGGRSSAAFAFFVFFIVATGLRRRPRTVLVHSIAYCSLFVLTAIISSTISNASSLELNQIVIRSLLLALATTAMTIFAVERDRLLASVTSTANASVDEWSDLEAALFALLGPVADLAPGSRVALVWADTDEPWTNIAVLDDELTVKHIAPGDDEIEGDDSFICGRLADHDSVVTRLTSSGLVTVRGAPLPAPMNEALSPAPHSIVGVAARGQIFSGHLLILDWKRIPSDFVLRAEILARHVATSLDNWMLSRRAAELAAREERARVWRDLHDGVLQSLTGLALMLARAEQAVDADPAEARRILGQAATLVHDEQRDLRLSILEQKAAASSPDLPAELPALASELAKRFEQVWDLQVDVNVDHHIAMSPTFTAEIARMIQEALSNSARHGQSTRARLRVTERDHQLFVTIEDNGKGFPFVGTFSHVELIEKRIGPILLKDRVQRLHGTLDIRSAPTGVGLDIRIPLRGSRLAV